MAWNGKAGVRGCEEHKQHTSYLRQHFVGLLVELHTSNGSQKHNNSRLAPHNLSAVNVMTFIVIENLGIDAMIIPKVETWQLY